MHIFLLTRENKDIECVSHHALCLNFFPFFPLSINYNEFYAKRFPFRSAVLSLRHDNRLRNERTSTTSDVILLIWPRVRAGQILLTLLA